MGKDSLQKLGRYTLLDRIAQGGSAEVYRGLLQTREGLQRLVAIKCIHRDHTEDQSFTEMFRDEIKVSLGLNHPSIVPTFDFGEDRGRPFIVFEYVHGRSLKQALDRGIKLGRAIPVELSMFVVEQAAGALGYAHEFRDPITQTTLNIIHRDISPQNILISYDGIPKVIDFGIAKVLQEDDRTQTGFIKGKPAYLSPEQVQGKTLDGRSDLFSLATVLWEALSGKRLFGGKEHATILLSIIDESFKIPPPSRHNPSVTPAADKIIMQALERDREKRQSGVREFQSQLYRILNSQSRDAYFRDLSATMNALFADDIQRDAAHLRELNEMAQEVTQTFGVHASWLLPGRTEPVTELDQRSSGAREIELETQKIELEKHDPPVPRPSTPSSSRIAARIVPAPPKPLQAAPAAAAAKPDAKGDVPAYDSADDPDYEKTIVDEVKTDLWAPYVMKAKAWIRRFQELPPATRALVAAGALMFFLALVRGHSKTQTTSLPVTQMRPAPAETFAPARSPGGEPGSPARIEDTPKIDPGIGPGGQNSGNDRPSWPQ